MREFKNKCLWSYQHRVQAKWPCVFSLYLCFIGKHTSNANLKWYFKQTLQQEKLDFCLITEKNCDFVPLMLINSIPPIISYPSIVPQLKLFSHCLWMEI